jgi:WD40 repeat protein
MLQNVKRSGTARMLGANTTGRISSADHVAQVSNLLYRRFPIGSRFERSSRPGPFQRPGGLETRDTADWKSALRSFALASILFALAPASIAQEKITYADHVIPVLRNHCFNCHNQDRTRGDLDLSTFNGVLKGSSSGQIVVPGDADASKIYKVITHAEEPAMPPNSPKISDAEINVIRTWIAGGLLERSGSKALTSNQPKVNLAMGTVSKGKPDGPPPMPEDWLLEPVIRTEALTAITGLAASPWAPVIGLAGQKQVLLYGSDHLDLLGVLPFTNGQPVTLTFSRNAQLLLVGGGRGGHSGRTLLFNVTSGERITEVGDEYDAVLAADISSDQTQIALGGPARQVKVFSTRTGELVHSMKKHTDWVTALEFSPDSVLLATGDRNGGLFVWEAESRQELYQLNGHRAAITAVSWRPDSDVVVSASEDGTMKLWEMHEGKQVRSWNAHNGGVLSAAFTHDGRMVSCGRDSQIAIWDATGNKQRSFDFAGELPVRVRFSHDGGRVFATAWSGKVGVWNSADGTFLGELSPNPPNLAERLEAAQKVVDSKQAARDASATALAAAETESNALLEKAKALSELVQGVKQLGENAAALHAKLTAHPLTATDPKEAAKVVSEILTGTASESPKFKSTIERLEQLSKETQDLPKQLEAAGEKLAQAKAATDASQHELLAATQSLRKWQAAQANVSVHRARETLQQRRVEHETAEMGLREVEAEAATLEAELRQNEKAAGIARLRVEGFQNVLKFDLAWHDEVRLELDQAEKELARLQSETLVAATEENGTQKIAAPSPEIQEKIHAATNLVAAKQTFLAERAAELSKTRENLAAVETEASASVEKQKALEQRASEHAARLAQAKSAVEESAKHLAAEQQNYEHLLAEYKKLKPL